MSRCPGPSPWVALAYCWQREGPLPWEEEAALHSPTAMWVLRARGRTPRRQRRREPPSRMPGRQTAEADCNALGLAYRLLNVHVHLLFVVGLGDPRGIGGAGRCEWFGRRKAYSVHGRMPDAGTEGIGKDAACPGWVNSKLAFPVVLQRQHRDGGEAARREAASLLETADRRVSKLRPSCTPDMPQTCLAGRGDRRHFDRPVEDEAQKANPSDASSGEAINPSHRTGCPATRSDQLRPTGRMPCG